MSKLGWLRELEELNKKASPAPWEHKLINEGQLSVADRDFINAVRNDFPELLSLLKDAEELLWHYLGGESGCDTPGRCERHKDYMCWTCTLIAAIDKFQEARGIEDK